MDGPSRPAGVYVFGAFRLDPVRRILWHGAERVRLGERLLDVLLYLVSHHDRLVSRDDLISAVWGGRIVEDTSLAQALYALRKALQAVGAAEGLIVTLPGRGYRFAAPVALELASPDPVASLPAPPAPTDPVHRPFLRHAFLRWGPPAALAALCLTILLAQLPARHHRPPQPPAPPPHSVAVLAFANMSGDPAQAYFSDGLSEQLIDALARIGGLQVAARTSSFSFRDGKATVAQIAHVLNVATVLEGSVRRDGGRMRVTAQLIDAGTGFQLWSRAYDRTQGDILQLQTDIAQSVAGSLQVALLGDTTARLAEGSTANPAAMDLYLRGMKQMRSGSIPGFTDALTRFGQAIQLDPAFARAESGRAYALLNLAMADTSPDPAPVRREFADALAASARAIALAPDIATGHAARASILDNGFLDPSGAAAEIARALALEPGSASVQGNAAQIDLDVGRVSEGVAAAERATVLDPLRPDVWENLAYVLWQAHRNTQALAALDREAALDGTLPPTAYDLRGRIDLTGNNAAAAVQDCPRGDGDLIQRCLAMAYHALGREQAAEATLAAWRKAQGDPPFALAEIYAQWGRIADAAHNLTLAVQTRDPAVEQMKADPLLDPIRATPQFASAERAMHFPP